MTCTFTDGQSHIDDSAIIHRLISAFHHASAGFLGHGASMWAGFDPLKTDINEALTSRDVTQLSRLLREPSSNELFYGFDNLTKKLTRRMKRRLRFGINTKRDAFEELHRLLFDIAGAAGVARVFSSEGPIDRQRRPPVEDILTSLDEAFGFKIDFPNPYPDEFGIVTSRGIASYRAIQALCQTWRSKTLLNRMNGKRLLEIGAGLGRNAYYAVRFGIENYTIIDLPITQVAQGYFLGRTLGGETISLSGEMSPAQIRIRSPDWLFKNAETFDLVINVDSLTELDKATADSYVRYSKEQAKAFWSMNHEYNLFTVS
jgi:hypothetical protein